MSAGMQVVAIFIALLAAAGAIWAFVDMGRGLSFTLAKRTPPPAAPGRRSDRHRLGGIVQIADFRRLGR